MSNNSSSQKITVLYHANCLDGFGAAYAAWRYYHEQAQYIPVAYDEPAPIAACTNALVYLVDFCYPFEVMQDICIAAREVVILDHHKTSVGIKERLQIVSDERGWNCNISGIHDLERSGAVISWDWFHNSEEDTPAPPMLLHIQDRDLWQFKLSFTREITAALAEPLLVDRSFDYWHILIKFWKLDKELLIDYGEALVASRQSRCTALAEKAYPVIFQGITGLAVNAPYDIASELGNMLAEKSGTFGAVWQYEGQGKYKVSLRSIKGSGCDVAAIASKCGGGGHENAAGFSYNYNREDGVSIEAMWQEVQHG